MAKSKGSRRKGRERAGKRRAGESRRVEVCADESYECWINGDWSGHGTAGLVVIRPGRDGGLAFADFVIDRLCLGLKDAFARFDLTRSEIDEKVLAPLRERMEMVPIDIESARDLVAGAIRFGRGHGFRPPRGYQRCAKMIGVDRDRVEHADVSAFGDGDRLFFLGTARELRRFLVGQTVEQFIARPDVTVELIDEAEGDDLPFDDPELELDDEAVDAMYEAMEAQGAEIANKVRMWCRFREEEPSPVLDAACTIQFLGVMDALAHPDDELGPEHLGHAREKAKAFIEACPEGERAELTRGVEQVERFVRSFDDPGELCSALGLGAGLR